MQKTKLLWTFLLATTVAVTSSAQGTTRAARVSTRVSSASSQQGRSAVRPASVRAQTPARPTTPTTAPTTAATTPPTAGTTPPATPPANGTTPSRALSADQVAANVQAFYDRTNDFEAEFVQVSRNRLSGAEQRRQGRVRFRKPGRMRWDYTTPAGDVIVSDGTTLWAYEAVARQAIQSNLQGSQLPSALSFLTGTGRLANDFTFELLDANQFRYPNGYVLQLRPRVPNASFERILFYIEPANFQVARTVLIDAQSNQNRFDFTNARVNLNPAQSTFQWSPPTGTNIVRP